MALRSAFWPSLNLAQLPAAVAPFFRKVFTAAMS
jgi:hypothetical protein